MIEVDWFVWLRPGPKKSFSSALRPGHEAVELPTEAGDIRSRKSQESDGQRDIQLPEQTVLRLEQLRQLTGKESIAEVIAEAVELYVVLRTSGDFAQEHLLPRQREVLRLLADGISTKGIAARLRISVRTAEFHRARLMKKLGIRDVAGLVRYAIRTGVILPCRPKRQLTRRRLSGCIRKSRRWNNKPAIWLVP
jgi:DNA-binding CsgD family transcriptional regulator